MTLKIVALMTVATGALALGACHPVVRIHDHSLHASGPITVVDKLDCPENEGKLTRTAASADGQSCDYSGPNDEVVNLTRVTVPTGQTPQSVMASAETALGGLIVQKQGQPEVKISADEKPGGDKANVDMPGIHIHADGDKSDVKIFGVNIHSDGDKADIHAGSGNKQADIHANGNGATIRANDNDNGNTEMVFVLAGDPATSAGYRAVGYIARGPAAGPLIVAQFKTKTEHHGDRDNGDLDDLIRRNAKSS
jgi:hypothetical protein